MLVHISLPICLRLIMYQISCHNHYSLNRMSNIWLIKWYRSSKVGQIMWAKCYGSNQVVQKSYSTHYTSNRIKNCRVRWVKSCGPNVVGQIMWSKNHIIHITHQIVLEIDELNDIAHISHIKSNHNNLVGQILIFLEFNSFIFLQISQLSEWN